MHTIGLTGGIGSGKSLIAQIFNHLGIPVFNADAESKKMLDEDIDILVEGYPKFKGKFGIFRGSYGLKVNREL